MKFTYLDISIVFAWVPPRLSIKLLWLFTGKYHMYLTETDRLLVNWLWVSPIDIWTLIPMEEHFHKGELLFAWNSVVSLRKPFPWFYFFLALDQCWTQSYVPWHTWKQYQPSLRDHFWKVTAEAGHLHIHVLLHNRDQSCSHFWIFSVRWTNCWHKNRRL